MDPNAALTETRERVDIILGEPGHVPEVALELAEYVQALDEWISRGGFLPKDWSRDA